MTAQVCQIGFIGLGAMGFGMACNLLKQPEYNVEGYDVYPPSASKFVAQSGQTQESPREVARNKSQLIIMAANVQQVETIIFDEQSGVLATLPKGATILICSTIPPTFYDTLKSRLENFGRADILIVDCPVSGGTKRAAEGKLTIFASGTPDALKNANALLTSMSETLHIIEGDEGTASKIKMVNQLLVGIHIAVAAEAMGLAAKAGLNTREVYNIITNAAGNSWAFENRVPHMLGGDWTPLSALNIFVKDMGIVTSTARTLQVPTPLASTAEQLYIAGAAQGFGSEDDAGLVRLFLPGCPEKVKEQASAISDTSKLAASTTAHEISKIGIVGLGAMGQGMAASLVRAGFNVHGYDVFKLSIDKFASLGENASPASSPADAAKDASLLILMVQNALQAEDVLFGSGRVVDVLPDDAIVMLSSTVAPSFVKELQEKLHCLGRGIQLVDAPVSGGVVRAANGTLTIMYSGEKPALSKIDNPLLAMAGTSANLYEVQGGAGAASSVKMINQLLAGCHIAAAAESMAFATRLGLDARQVLGFIGNAAAWSWMLENRSPQMLDQDWTPHSALAIFVKDLGIVLGAAKRLTYFAPMTSTAHTMYLTAASRGWSKEADAGIVRLWDVAKAPNNTGLKDETQQITDQASALPRLKVQDALSSLPLEYSGDVLGSIKQMVDTGAVPALVVLDDDPTGTQTCHDIDVLTVWDIETLRDQFNLTNRGFFILTNSRALASDEAKALITEICQNVKLAAQDSQTAFEIVLRGDSTLRGHLPQEPDAVEETIGRSDGWILAPFFFQGGRYTIDDVHYIKENDVLVPVNQTPFAQDATFGYQNANLRQYVKEKCPGRFDDSSFVSITLEDIRLSGPAGVAKKLLSVNQPNSVFIVNAAAESDMHVFVAGLLEAEKAGRRYLYRTGAAFVSSRLGIRGISPLTLQDLGISSNSTGTPGGLIIAGSYVPKTTAQLKVLREKRGDKLSVIELDVAELLKEPMTAESIVQTAASEASNDIAHGKDVLVMTSRSLIKGSDASSSLDIGSQVAKALVQLLEKVEVRPRYIIAKGGITSSDAASKGLRMRRARILGQAAPGVPLWRCDEETSRHQGVPYVVFPGNVGTDHTLLEVVEGWSLE
ncbi:hypothetical protein FSARC_10385 [Fusarium sarcochroum]|uniref:3-hydroxyisobutyrate dehydrogenase n=1 Tax=Fusarium sarcochroum TaxID=1208366 RepID=A0A8H4TMQ9_9HYPO|nr:hypothetical protein FSARC_10385 [Fusarium sarcochroum]